MSENLMSAAREIVNASQLSDGQRAVLSLMLEKSGDRFQSVFVEQFAEHIGEVPKFFADMQEKMDARDNPEALGAIYEREKKELEALAVSEEMTGE